MKHNVHYAVVGDSKFEFLLYKKKKSGYMEKGLVLSTRNSMQFFVGFFFFFFLRCLVFFCLG